jgi:hypothetical protein
MLFLTSQPLWLSAAIVVTRARRVRLVAAEGAVPGIVWLVLFGGALLTVVFTFSSARKACARRP